MMKVNGRSLKCAETHRSLQSLSPRKVEAMIESTLVFAMSTINNKFTRYLHVISLSNTYATNSHVVCLSWFHHLSLPLHMPVMNHSQPPRLEVGDAFEAWKKCRVRLQCTAIIHIADTDHPATSPCQSRQMVDQFTSSMLGARPRATATH